MSDKVLLKRMAFKDKHKIQDHSEETEYCVEREPYIRLSVFKISPVAGEGKVKIVHRNLLLPFEGNIEGVLRTRKI